MQYQAKDSLSEKYRTMLPNDWSKMEIRQIHDDYDNNYIDSDTRKIFAFQSQGEFNKCSNVLNRGKDITRPPLW